MQVDPPPIDAAPILDPSSHTLRKAAGRSGARQPPDIDSVNGGKPQIFRAQELRHYVLGLILLKACASLRRFLCDRHVGAAEEQTSYCQRAEKSLRVHRVLLLLESDRCWKAIASSATLRGATSPAEEW